MNDVALDLGMEQPSVSKHLRVLREVDLVTMRQDGRRRIYAANPEGLKHVHAWVSQFERMWTRQLNRIAAKAERRARRNK